MADVLSDAKYDWIRTVLGVDARKSDDDDDDDPGGGASEDEPGGLG